MMDTVQYKVAALEQYVLPNQERFVVQTVNVVRTIASTKLVLQTYTTSIAQALQIVCRHTTVARMVCV